MTYTRSTTKTKVAQYDLPGIKDKAPHIWSHVKVACDKYALWGISHWRDQRKSFYAYARGRQSRGDVYSTKRILAVTHVKVMRKHRYGYLEEIVVRRADNALYKFKEDDFPQLQINDIEEMLLLVVQNQLTNTLGVDINITKPNTTRPDLRKRHPYTPYKDPQGFIYVDKFKRNRLMRFDELYKFSDGTLTRLLSSLEDITKNIDMEYLPKRRWSTLEKKRAHFMIKDINKLLKERRIMRSLEKFVGGRLYETDLILLVHETFGKRRIMPTEMELTLEQTQQDISYEVSFDEYDTYVLERFDTSARNPVKEILLKLNLPDHRIFKDGGEGT
ncbi:hypothetical protein Tco_0256809 [Tanacetum coccineum]